MIDIKNLSVLIADDMQSMRRTVKGMLKAMSFRVSAHYATNGKEAWQTLEDPKNKVDVAIIDWNMPVMNGQELIERIRADKRLRDMPVIMITAENTKDIITGVLESDVNAYLLKPITLEVLEEKLKLVIQLANKPPQFIKHLMAARDYEEVGEIEAAITEIQSALKLRSQSSKVIRNLGLLYGKLDKTDVAEKCLTKAASINKYDLYTRTHLVDFYMERENVKKAAQYYMESVFITPKAAGKGIDIGKHLLKQDKLDEAIKVFNFAINNGMYKNRIREEVADIYLENGLYPEAKEVLKKLFQVLTDRHDIAMKLGYLFERDRDITNALICYVRADETTRDNFDAKVLIAKLYLQKRNEASAAQYLDAVLKINPNHEDALDLRKDINIPPPKEEPIDD